MIRRYSWWKYTLLFIIAVLGILYALPNLFGEDPALQVIGRRGVTVNEQTLAVVKTTLTQRHVHFRDATVKDQSLLIRLPDTSSQLQAKEIISQELGDRYVTALDLVPAEPQWLLHLGAQPMKLGLDLRGGMQFLLEVDMETVLHNQLLSYVDDVKKSLALANLADAHVMLQKKRIIATFTQAADINKAVPFLSKNVPGLTIEKNTSHDQITLTLSEALITQAEKYALAQTVTVMRNRVNELGVTEASVAPQGTKRVVVELPGVQDAAQAKALIGGTASLRFMLVDTQHELTSALNGQVPQGSKIYWSDSEQPTLLFNRAILTGKSVVSANVGFDRDNQPAVNIRISGDEVSHFSQVTRDNVGHSMAVVLIQTQLSTQHVKGKAVLNRKVTERVISVATIQQALGNSFQITNIGSIQDAQNLAMQVRAGALPAPVQIISDQVIGPTLGKENIRVGLISMAIAMGLTLAFMLMYYRGLGIVANVALLLNLIFLIAIMSIIGATMTLPGIAGAVLHVGMAVDANVLIFERIREELRQGTHPHRAIEEGFDRAFATIVDSNITTLIVAFILFIIGSGAVKGFATVLIIGIATSMLTAVTMTRGLIYLIYGNRPIKKISIGI